MSTHVDAIYFFFQCSLEILHIGNYFKNRTPVIIHVELSLYF